MTNKPLPDHFGVPLRPYGKAELAQMYMNGTCSDPAARKWLRQEIRKCPGLLAELYRLGYDPKQKNYTVAQVRALFNAIGEPGPAPL